MNGCRRRKGLLRALLAKPGRGVANKHGDDIDPTKMRRALPGQRCIDWFIIRRTTDARFVDFKALKDEFGVGQKKADDENQPAQIVLSSRIARCRL